MECVAYGIHIIGSGDAGDDTVLHDSGDNRDDIPLCSRGTPARLIRICEVIAVKRLILLLLFFISASFATNIIGCQNLTTANGVYVLTANISGAATTCIYITANNVTLNLDGHTIAGIGNDIGIVINSNLTRVANGTISTFHEGIRSYGVSNNLSNIEIHNTTGTGMIVWGASHNILTNISSHGSLGNGFHNLVADDNTYINCSSYDNGDAGFNVEGSSRNNYTGNTAYNNTGTCLAAYSGVYNNSFTGNTFYECGNGLVSYVGGGNNFTNNIIHDSISN
jgi:parallel beta-helix repeat protein